MLKKWDSPFRLFLPLVLLAMAFLNCSTNTSTAAFPTDVYVAGYVVNAAGNPVATLWKNGNEIPLTDGTISSKAYGVTVSGADVYAVGGLGASAVYWKNGVMVKLTDGTNEAFATCLCVAGTDVYAAGYECDPAMHGMSRAKYWKNGAPTLLSNGPDSSQANAIVVDGANVYVAGWEVQSHLMETTDYIGNQAVVWTNGQESTLTAFNNSGIAFGLAVVNGNVYVAGTEYVNGNGVAKYWVNGTPTVLTTGNPPTACTGLAVRGNRVYTCGFQGPVDGIQDVGIMWQDSTAIPLAVNGYGSFINAMALSPATGEVYLTGVQETSKGSKVALWQGTQAQPQYLTDGSQDASAFAICVHQETNF